jgi:hypothetical protein
MEGDEMQIYSRSAPRKITMGILIFRLDRDGDSQCKKGKC